MRSLTLADLPTPTPATLLRIERLLRQCEPPPRSDRAAGLGRADGTQNLHGVPWLERDEVHDLERKG